MVNRWQSFMRPAARGRRFSSFLRWILIDGAWRFRGLVTRMIAAGALGVAFQVQAIGLALYYARLTQHAGSVTLLDAEFVARESFGLLLAVALACLITLAASAVLIYYANSRRFVLWAAYSEFCTIRVFDLLHQSAREPHGIDEVGVLRAVKKDANCSGRALSLVVSAFVPACALVAAACTLLWLNTALTSILMLLTLAAGAAYYLINMRAARDSARMERHASGTTSEYRRIFRAQRSLLESIPNESLHLKSLTCGDVRKYRTAFHGRLIAMAKSELASNLFLSCGIFATTIFLGWSILSDRTGWQRLAVYLIGLSYAAKMFRSVNKTITSISRFYPQVQRYANFVSGQTASADPTPHPRSSYRLASASTLAEANGKGSRNALKLTPSHRLAIVCPLPLDRFSLPTILSGLLDEQPDCIRAVLNSIRTVPASYRGHDASLGELVASGNGAAGSHLEHWADRCGLTAELEVHLPDRFGQRLSLDEWNRVPPSLKTLLAAVPAIHHDSQWVCFDDASIARLPEQSQRDLLAALADRIVVILFTSDLSRVGAYGEHFVAVQPENGLQQAGDLAWFQRHRASIEQQIAATRGTKAAGVLYADDEDDDIDDF